jgi:hypothetical protein
MGRPNYKLKFWTSYYLTTLQAFVHDNKIDNSHNSIYIENDSTTILISFYGWPPYTFSAANFISLSNIKLSCTHTSSINHNTITVLSWYIDSFDIIAILTLVIFWKSSMITSNTIYAGNQRNPIIYLWIS